MADIRRMDRAEWRALRELRLQALGDSPEAFGRTLEEEQAFPDDRWREIADGVVFVAVEGGAWLGMTGVYEADPNTAGIWGMWVAPAHRRRGLGEALLDAAMGWIRDQGFRVARLDVTEVNTPADALYRKAGFAPTGHTRPLREGSQLTVVEMERT